MGELATPLADAGVAAPDDDVGDALGGRIVRLPVIVQAQDGSVVGQVGADDLSRWVSEHGSQPEASHTRPHSPPHEPIARPFAYPFARSVAQRGALATMAPSRAPIRDPSTPTPTLNRPPGPWRSAAPAPSRRPSAFVTGRSGRQNRRPNGSFSVHMGKIWVPAVPIALRFDDLWR